MVDLAKPEHSQGAVGLKIYLDPTQKDVMLRQLSNCTRQEIRVDLLGLGLNAVQNILLPERTSLLCYLCDVIIYS
jgi:hypothetical protein